MKFKFNFPLFNLRFPASVAKDIKNMNDMNYQTEQVEINPVATVDSDKQALSNKRVLHELQALTRSLTSSDITDNFFYSKFDPSFAKCEFQSVSKSISWKSFIYNDIKIEITTGNSGTYLRVTLMNLISDLEVFTFCETGNYRGDNYQSDIQNGNWDAHVLKFVRDLLKHYTTIIDRTKKSDAERTNNLIHSYNEKYKKSP